MDICVAMGAVMYANMCVDMHTDVSIHMCVGVCVEMWMDVGAHISLVRIQTCVSKADQCRHVPSTCLQTYATDICFGRCGLDSVFRPDVQADMLAPTSGELPPSTRSSATYRPSAQSSATYRPSRQPAIPRTTSSSSSMDGSIRVEEQASGTG